MSVGVLPKLRLTHPSVKPVSVAHPASEPAETLQIQCERDIVDAVCMARERMCEVRPFGGKGSKNDCYGTDGLSLDLSGYGGVLDFDGRTVTVQAGIKVGRLNEFLRHRGAIVPTCGEWQGATVSGSLATGSHGGSSHYGIHPTSVLGLRLVTADGRVMNIGRDSPYFDHAAVSIGMLGVISTVTLACEPAFHLELETRVVPLDDYLRDYVGQGNAADFSAAVWFPTVHRVLTFTANRVPPRAHAGPRMQRFSVKTFLFDAAARYLDQDVVSDEHLAHTWVDDGDRILCPIEDLTAKIKVLRVLSQDWRATELAVPVEAAPEVIERIDRVLHDHRDALLNAVGLRMTPADGFSLSPCFGRDTFWIDVFFDEWDSLFAYDLADAVADSGGRCHWGKYLTLDPAHLRGQYPRLDEFRTARAALDPDGLFANAYTRRMEM